MTAGRPGAHRHRARHRGPRAAWLLGVRLRADVVVSTCTVLAVTLVFWRHLLPHLATWSQARDGDEGIFLFWFAHFPHAVLHGHSPLFADAVNAPAGVNATWNTSVLTPAMLLAPVTVLGGPVLAYNLAVMLAMAATAGACVAACRRFVTWWPAALAGGCLAGFGPYVVVQSQGHLNIACTAIPALLLLMGHELLVRRRTRRWVLGVLLAVLLTLQFGISTEGLASCVVLATVGVAVLAVQSRQHVTGPLVRQAAATLGIAAVATLVLLAAALWVLLAGRQRLTGPVQATAAFSADLLSPVLPTGQQHFAPAAAVARTAAFSGNAVENTAYVGAPLLLLVMATVVTLRRRPVVRWAAAMALISLVLSFGPRLRVDGRVTTVRLPFAALEAAPLLDSAAAVRYSFATLLFCAVVASVALDVAVARLRERVRRGHGWRAGGWPGAWPVLALGAAVVAVGLPLTPGPEVPYPAQPLRVPAFYTSPALRSVVPAGAVVVSYPYLNRFQSLPLTELALTGVRFRQLGVYGFTPAPGGGAPRFDVPTATAYAESRVAAGLQPDARRTGAVLDELVRLRVAAVLVDEDWPRSEAAVAFWTRALGRPPLRTGGVAAWGGVAAALADHPLDR